MSNKILPICEKRLPPQNEAVALKNVQNYVSLANHRGTISSVAKYFSRAMCCKSVAKTISQKVPSPERRINTGVFGCCKPRGTTPTPKYKTDFN